MLSPLGPALQLQGGSKEISASSFWMRFADDDSPPLFIVPPAPQGNLRLQAAGESDAGARSSTTATALQAR